MDMLNQEILNSLLSSKSGDTKIDELNYNISRHFVGFLKEYEADLNKIDSNARNYSPAGLKIERDKAGTIARQKMEAIDDKASWTTEIKEVEKRFNGSEEKSDIERLLQYSQEREAREYISSIAGDIGKRAMFEQRIMEGDPIAIGAVQNSFYDMNIDPSIMQVGVDKMRLNSNPAAAQRLEVLQNGEDTYQGMKKLFNAEFGSNEVDIIKVLAAGD